MGTKLIWCMDLGVPYVTWRRFKRISMDQRGFAPSRSHCHQCSHQLNRRERRMFGAFEAAKIVEKYGDKHGDKHGKIWGIRPARKICRSQIGLAKSMFLFSLVTRSKKHLLLQISHGGWVAPPVDLVLQSPMPYYSGNKFPKIQWFITMFRYKRQFWGISHVE